MNNNDNNIQDLQEMQLQCSEYQEKLQLYTDIKTKRSIS